MNPLLAAANVTFAYATEPVVSDVSLALSAGEIVALIGPNGSGKSTLQRLLLGHLRGRGTVEWEGRAIHRWSRRELAKKVAYLPQAPTFDADHRVIDVLRLGRAAHWSAFGIESRLDAQVVEQVAQELSLGDLLGRRIDQLSGGQRQRVFVARCVVQQPAAMLLDEPSTFLDLRHQVDLLQLLRKFARERSIGILMASHDLNLIAGFTDRMILLHEGRIAASGTPAEVMQEELLSRVYGVAMERIERRGTEPPVLLPRGA